MRDSLFEKTNGLIFTC